MFSCLKWLWNRKTQNDKKLNTSLSQTSIRFKDETLKSTAIPGQSGFKNNDNKGVTKNPFANITRYSSESLKVGVLRVGS